ncbi:MAG TPA: L-histidine N(alpha)-methyltransferase [Terracidiphilus sp.]|nr:L-histidine N(alpha)-methyltransferase [Terracidiphilus sp.]
MASAASSATFPQIETPAGAAVRRGLSLDPKRLPPWLFYDEAGSRLFDRITELPEYYLTRTERSILAAHAAAIIERAADGARLRIAELGAGSATKTCLLLAAAVEQQRKVLYEPIDVSASALRSARRRIEAEIAGVTVIPRAMDYTNGLGFAPLHQGERRLVLYIGSSIGNFEPDEALALLRRVRATLRRGDVILLGIDLVKDRDILLEAYDDAAGVTATFNRNMLVRLNREFGADFNPLAFAHRAFWNTSRSRIEMHLESRRAQRVYFAGLDMSVQFAAGESIHTENSYKYAWGQPEAMLAQAGFDPVDSWTDEKNWFAVCLGRAR